VCRVLSESHRCLCKACVLGSAPGPADFLALSNGHRGSYFPPPVARSPMKTGLTGSPRRTPGARSSPALQSDQPSPSPSSGRQRNSKSMEIARESARSDRRPLNDRRPNTAPITNGLRSKGKEKELAFESEAAVDFSDNENNLVNGDENLGEHSGTLDDLTEHFTVDGSGNRYDDFADYATHTDDIEPHDVSEEESPSFLASGTRKLRQSDSAGVDVDGNRSSKKATDDAQKDGSKRKRPGRPPKAPGNVHEDSVEQRPSKKPRSLGKDPGSSVMPLDPELEKVVENYTNRTGPLKGRSLYILKRETPSDERATHTRSGRVSVRPLAYWRNERCVYGDAEAEVGQRFPLSTIKEIIRTEELQPEKRRMGKHKSSIKRSRSRKSKDDESEDGNDDENNADAWETEGGVLHGYIRKWNPEIQAVTDEEEVLGTFSPSIFYFASLTGELVDIAYAPSGIETRDVKNSTFRFAKLLSSPFIGSGIVEIPPGGVKKPKNSKRMHMVFYVCHGRVQVDISGVQFSAGKGCVFQVPRGSLSPPRIHLTI
jgi:centromere protein C